MNNKIECEYFLMRLPIPQVYIHKVMWCDLNSEFKFCGLKVAET
jgi:hypothetical protein